LDIIETGNGYVLRHPQPSFAKGANRTDGRDFIEREERSEMRL
jgi:hypothetical protein